MKTIILDWWKISDKVMKFILTVILGIAIGYGWAYKIYLTDVSKCEKDSLKLENEFHESVTPQKAHSFHIFNGQFEIWPVNLAQKMFHYKKVKKVTYAGASDDGGRKTWGR